MNRLLCILFLCILMTSCGNKINSKTYLNESSLTQLQTESVDDELKIVRSHTSVKLGEIGFITVEGKPGVRYTITTSYKMGNRTIPVTQWRVSGEDGQVTFNWVVEPETVPGTYSAEISGGGKKLNISHTVIP